MDYGMFNFILRVAMLQMIAITSQVALSKRRYAIALFTFGVWFTLFRLTFLRALAMYSGVFGKNGELENTRNLLTLFSGSIFANITDTFVFIGLIALLLYVVKIKEGVKLRNG